MAKANSPAAPERRAKADGSYKNALPDFRANTIELSKTLFQLSGIQFNQRRVIVAGT
jgi:hypothetical protein